MTSAVAVFGRNDLRGVRRDSLMIGVVAAPLGWIAMVRFGTPPVTTLLAEQYQVDLVPYYPLILTGFLLLSSAIVIGGVTALLVLDERDANTLTALRITPVPFSRYIAYRAGTAILLTALIVVGTMSASGLLPSDLILSLIPIGLLTGLSALVVMLAMLALARNKVEGLAVIRGLGIVMAGLPILPYFIDSDWHLAFGLLPTYWPAKAYWVATDGGAWWPYLIAGAVYNILVAWSLYRRFAASLG